MQIRNYASVLNAYSAASTALKKDGSSKTTFEHEGEIRTVNKVGESITFTGRDKSGQLITQSVRPLGKTGFEIAVKSSLSATPIPGMTYFVHKVADATNPMSLVDKKVAEMISDKSLEIKNGSIESHDEKNGISTKVELSEDAPKGWTKFLQRDEKRGETTRISLIDDNLYQFSTRLGELYADRKTGTLSHFQAKKTRSCSRSACGEGPEPDNRPGENAPRPLEANIRNPNGR